MHSVLLTFFMCLKLKIHQPIYKESGIASKEGAIIKYMLWILEGDLGYSAGFLLKSKYMFRLAISEQGLAFWLTPVTFQLKEEQMQKYAQKSQKENWSPDHFFHFRRNQMFYHILAAAPGLAKAMYVVSFL